MQTSYVYNITGVRVSIRGSPPESWLRIYVVSGTYAILVRNKVRVCAKLRACAPPSSQLFRTCRIDIRYADYRKPRVSSPAEGIKLAVSRINPHASRIYRLAKSSRNAGRLKIRSIWCKRAHPRVATSITRRNFYATATLLLLAT